MSKLIRAFGKKWLNKADKYCKTDINKKARIINETQNIIKNAVPGKSKPRKFKKCNIIIIAKCNIIAAAPRIGFSTKR